MWENFKTFWSEPYKGAASMSALDWFLFVGMILIILILWNVILNHVKEATT